MLVVLQKWRLTEIDGTLGLMVIASRSQTTHEMRGPQDDSHRKIDIDARHYQWLVCKSLGL